MNFSTPKPSPMHLLFLKGKLLLSHLAVAISIFLTCACAPYPGHQVQDLREMPQDPRAYLEEVSADRRLMSKTEQDAAAQDFLTRHFSPWGTNTPLVETRHPFWALEWLDSGIVFGHNLLPLDKDTISDFRRRCSAAEYPSMGRHAISTHHTDVRALPSSAPLFSDIGQEGEGFPFDQLQHGVLPAGSPMLVTHMSTDKNWLFVETPLLYGWVKATAVAWADEEFKDAYTTDDYVSILKDRISLHSISGAPLSSTRAGTILPLIHQDSAGYILGMPHRDAEGNASVVHVRIQESAAHIFPLPFTPRQIAELSATFMHQPYSWGDRFSGRDCSGTMRDLFSPFGIWVPRNSGDQSAEGKSIQLGEIPLHQRRDYIAMHAVPFATLLHLPGHIMLYLGEHSGSSVVFHSVWGLRFQSLGGKEGRLRIGKTAITSLEPGRELDGMWCRVSSLLERLDQMNIPHLKTGE